MYSYIENWSRLNPIDAFIFEAAKKRKPNPYVKTPSKEENLARGRQAVLDIAHGVADRVEHAMYKSDVGWISFEKGVPGVAPPTKANPEKLLAWWNSFKTLEERKEAAFKSGHGLSHIIAKRDWEGEHIEQLHGQRGLDAALTLVQVIQNGAARDSKMDKVIEKYGYLVVLRRAYQNSLGNQDYWVWSGYKVIGGYDLRQDILKK